MEVDLKQTNVFWSGAGPKTLIPDMDAVNQASAERRAKEDARKPKRAEPEYDWRGELDELERRFAAIHRQRKCKSSSTARMQNTPKP